MSKLTLENLKSFADIHDELIERADELFAERAERVDGAEFLTVMNVEETKPDSIVFYCENERNYGTFQEIALVDLLDTERFIETAEREIDEKERALALKKQAEDKRRAEELEKKELANLSYLKEKYEPENVSESKEK